MTRYCLVVTFCFVASIGFIQAQSTGAEQAALAYADGRYDEAIAIYEDLIDAGQASGSLYVNLAHAYFGQGNRPQALLNYRRAAFYLPRDREIQAQLALLRRGNLPPTTHADWLLRADATAQIYTQRELAIGSLGLWSLLFGLLTLRLVLTKGRGAVNLLIIGCAICLFISVSALGIRRHVDHAHPAAILLAAPTSVMSGPGDDYLELYTLDDAVEMNIIATDGEWLRFVLIDGRQGWILRDSVGFIASDLG